MEAIPTEIKPRHSLTMIGLILLIGVLGGLGAVFFHILVNLFHNLFFYGKWNIHLNEVAHSAPSIWGFGLILVMIIVAPMVTWLIETFAYDERGLSVPEIMYALRHQEGKIRARVSFAKAFASSLTISVGGSLGREGPMVQLGAAISSLVCDVFPVPASQRIILVAAGAAAATAALFHTPIGGLLFTMELMLVSYDVFSVLLMLLATYIAVSVENVFLGHIVLFTLPTIGGMPYSYLLLFIPLGIIIGFISVGFIQGFYWSQDKLAQLFKNPYVRHMIGMALVGVLICTFMYYAGHYYIEGLGYATIQDLLLALITNPWLLIALFLGKLLATWLTLGSGASGGIFSTVLFLGAVLGALTCYLLQQCFPGVTWQPVYFVVAGMTAMLASVTGAVVAAVVIVLEMLHNFYLILPTIIAVITAYVVRKLCIHESIYTLKLKRRAIKLIS